MEKKSQVRNNEMIRAVRKTEISEQLYYGWSLSATKVTTTKALIIPALRLFWQKAYRTTTASFILYLDILIFLVKKTFRFQKLRVQNSANSKSLLISYANFISHCACLFDSFARQKIFAGFIFYGVIH